MTDMQSALKTVLNQWQDDSPNSGKSATMFKPSNNVTRQTFNTVKNNPGLSRSNITTLLGNQGYNKGSVSSLLGQMLKQHMIIERNGVLYPVLDEYVPLKSPALKHSKTKQFKRGPYKKAATAPAPAPVAQPKADPTKNVQQVLMYRSPDIPVSAIIDGMTLRQARAVYDELKKIFGDK